VANVTHEQAANSLSNLKMNDSSAKKIDFSVMDKENIPATSAATSTTETSENKKSIVEIVKPVETPKVAPGIKAQETDEPLLQENPHRFVLFPIKYHEVRVHFRALRVKYFITDTCRYGKCTRKPKRPSGLQKKSTYPKISTTGVSA
jgi:ribonucleoside-diphosphate reductase subunit M2